MMRINLAPTATYLFHPQVLCKLRSAQHSASIRSHFVTDQPFPISRSAFEVQPSSLPEPLLERLLGKSPLRRIVARVPCEGDNHTFLETLECGHQLYSYQEFNWEPGLNWLPILAKRRRCRECKALAEAVPSPKKPPQSVKPDIPKEGAA